MIYITKNVQRVRAKVRLLAFFGECQAIVERIGPRFTKVENEK